MTRHKILIIFILCTITIAVSANNSELKEAVLLVDSINRIDDDLHSSLTCNFGDKPIKDDSVSKVSCQNTMDVILTLFFGVENSWRHCNRIFTRKDYEALIQQLVDIEESLNKAKNLNDRLSLSKNKYELLDTYFADGEKNFVEIFGSSFQNGNKPKFDQAFIYNGTNNSGRKISFYTSNKKNIGMSYSTLVRNQKWTIAFFFDGSCKLTSITQDLDLGYHDGAQYVTKLKLSMGACLNLHKSSKDSTLEYGDLLNFLEQNQSHAIFTQTQSDLVMKKIKELCLKMIHVNKF